MAGRNSIQLLRGTETALAKHKDQILHDGQPLYDKTNNWLCIGNGGSIEARQSISMDFNQDALTTEEVEAIWGGAAGGSSSSAGSQLTFGTLSGSTAKLVITDGTNIAASEALKVLVDSNAHSQVYMGASYSADNVLVLQDTQMYLKNKTTGKTAYLTPDSGYMLTVNGNNRTLYLHDRIRIDPWDASQNTQNYNNHVALLFPTKSGTIATQENIVEYVTSGIEAAVKEKLKLGWVYEKSKNIQNGNIYGTIIKYKHKISNKALVVVDIYDYTTFSASGGEILGAMLVGNIGTKWNTSGTVVLLSSYNSGLLDAGSPGSITWEDGTTTSLRTTKPVIDLYQWNITNEAFWSAGGGVFPGISQDIAKTSGNWGIYGTPVCLNTSSTANLNVNLKHIIISFYE